MSLLTLILAACTPAGGVRAGPSEDRPATSDAPVEVEPSARVAILSPADGDVVSNPVTFTVQAEGVSLLHLSADGWSLGEPWSPDDDATATYTFNGTGYAREIRLSGLDDDRNVIASDTITLTIRDDEQATGEGGVLLDVPYFYQYDNAYEPSSTCGITSAAMLIDSFFPGRTTPDALYATYGKAQGQSPSGLAQLYAWEGLASDWTTTGTRDDIRAHLDAGRPVVAHGWWTSAGHVTVIIGYDDQDWIVNDPAGDWAECYGCGGGEAVRYPLGGEWDALMSTDGDLWISAADTAAF